jgi:hypothetical protein
LTDLADARGPIPVGKSTAVRIALSMQSSDWVQISDGTIRDALSAADRLLAFFSAHRNYFVIE